jgi:hypothetical protein
MPSIHGRRQSPLVRDLMTGRLLQYIERLQPLSNWQGFGVQSVTYSRHPSVSCREVEALGAALGASCQHRCIKGLSGEEAQEAHQGIPTWFPHVGNRYKLQ